MPRVSLFLALAVFATAACSASTAGIGVGIGGGSGGGGVWVQGSPGDLGRSRPAPQAATEGNALSVPASAQLSDGMRAWLQSRADLTDLKAINYALENLPAGEAMRWRNFDANLTYALSPGEMEDLGDRRCRDFELKMGLDDATGQAFSGSACREPGGPWSLTRGV